jgi:hypothetical protein
MFFFFFFPILNNQMADGRAATISPGLAHLRAEVIWHEAFKAPLKCLKE